MPPFPGWAIFRPLFMSWILAAERALADGRPIPEAVIAAGGQQLLHFLRAHQLADAEIERALAMVIHYLCHEGDYQQADYGGDVARVFHLLDCKTADLEILYRLTDRLGGLGSSANEFEIFRRLERVREIFDNIRDYGEDTRANSFNTVHCLEVLYGREDAYAQILRFLAQEYAEIARLIQREDNDKQERFALLEIRWERESLHYVGELNHLWKQLAV